MNQLAKTRRNPYYKGYRIGSTLMGETFIEKGGHHISWANNVQAAKKIIDMLTKPAKKTKKNLVLERKYSPAARAYIARIIRREIKAGVPFNQAVAMAHSEARRRGYKVPPRPNPSIWEELVSTPRRKTKKTKKQRMSTRSNPRRGVVIGDRAISLSYNGGKGKKKNSRWVHRFETPVEVLGMKDGSIKLRSKDGIKLWDWF